MKLNVKLYTSQCGGKKKVLQTVHMFGMLIYISFLLGFEVLVGGGKSFTKRFSRITRTGVKAKTGKHTAVNCHHFIQSLKGILKRMKGLFS